MTEPNLRSTPPVRSSRDAMAIPANAIQDAENV